MRVWPTAALLFVLVVSAPSVACAQASALGSPRRPRAQGSSWTMVDEVEEAPPVHSRASHAPHASECRHRRRDHGLIAFGATLFFASYITIATLGALFGPGFGASFYPLIHPIFFEYSGTLLWDIIAGPLTVLETIGFVLWVAGDAAHERGGASFSLGGPAGSVGLTVRGAF